MTDSEYQRLVEFLGTQFAEVDRRFSEVDRRAEERFRETLGHFDALYRRLERLEAEYFAIVQTLRRIETLLGTEQAQRAVLERSVTELRSQIVELQARLDAVEARLHD